MRVRTAVSENWTPRLMCSFSGSVREVAAGGTAARGGARLGNAARGGAVAGGGGATVAGLDGLPTLRWSLLVLVAEFSTGAAILRSYALRWRAASLLAVIAIDVSRCSSRNACWLLNTASSLNTDGSRCTPPLSPSCCLMLTCGAPLPVDRAARSGVHCSRSLKARAASSCERARYFLDSSLATFARSVDSQSMRPASIGHSAEYTHWCGWPALSVPLDSLVM